MLPELCIAVLLFNCFHKNMQLNFIPMANGYSETDIVHSAKAFKNPYRHLIRPPLEDDESLYLKSILQSKIEKNSKQMEDVICFSKKNIAKTGKFSYKKRTKTSRHKNKKSDAEKMIKSDGYGAETHTVYTTDGYVLRIHRILPGSKNKNKHKTTHRVILHHGLLGSSEDWLILGPGQALPYLLSDQGYDVWLLNARGNKYAREHRRHFLEPNKFWNFSWHEMGTHDLPAVIKYIHKSAYKAVTYFIGHSMGATALLVLLSTRPEYNRKLKSAVLLAPLAFMYHVQGPLKRLSEFHSHANISSIIDVNEFSTDGIFPQILNDSFCTGHNMDMICSNSLLLMADGGKDIYDVELKKSILSHVPAGTSTRTIVHYLQLIKSGFFRMYDYGKVNNYKRFFSEEPPNYTLEKITLPISLISSSSDWLSTESDITTLVTKLENVKVHHILKQNDFNHMDFVWSRTAQTLVFEPVLNILQRY